MTSRTREKRGPGAFPATRVSRGERGDNPSAEIFHIPHTENIETGINTKKVLFWLMAGKTTRSRAKKSSRPGLPGYSIKIGLINTGFTYICTRKGICRLFKSLCSDSQCGMYQKIQYRNSEVRDA
jgi:hypothetical protein